MSNQPILDTTKLDPNASAAEMSGEPIKGSKTCPLNVNKIQLLPLRYALVENLQPEANILNKAKSVPEQAPLLTQITSHPVGIRFMRYGWLYVYKYNTDGPSILGFKIQASRIVQGTKIDQEGNKTDYEPALIIDKTEDIQIRVCFCEEEWTTSKAKQVIANEAQRKLLMYPIVVGNLSCDFQSANILTKEQAPKNIADVAENHITQPNCYHDEENTPYVWIDQRTDFTPHDQLGKLNQQLTNNEGKQGHYAYIVVPDPIGMMLDLAAEQDKIIHWRQAWGEKSQSKGNNEFLYTMAHYIQGLLSINDTSANKYATDTDQWLTKLTPEQRQSIYDYINASNQNERTDRDRMPNKAYSYTFGYLLSNVRSNQSIATDQQIFQEEIGLGLEREKQNKDLEYTMIEKLGGVDKYHKEYRKKIEDLKEQHYIENYGSFVLGKQGTIDVVNKGALDQFLDQNDAYIKKWSEQLDKITQDRILLFTKYFHNATWYFDGDSDDQILSLQKIEAACVIGMVRNQAAIDTLKAFFNEYPYYLLPGYHIISYNTEVVQMGSKFKQLLNDTASFIKVLKTGHVEDDVDIAQVFPKNYWRKMLNFGSNSPVATNSELASFRHVIEDVYNTAALTSLNEVIEENIQRIPEKIQNRIKNKSDKISALFEDLEKVDFGGRAALFASVKAQGLLFVENDPIKQHTLQIEFGRIYNQLKDLKHLSDFIDEQSAKLDEKITNLKGSSADRYEGLEREQINKNIGLAKRKLMLGAIQLNKDCFTLSDKFSPVDNDQMPFTLKSTDASRRIDYKQIAKFEKDFKGKVGFMRMAAINFDSLMGSAWLPATLTYFQGKGMVEAAAQALKTRSMQDIFIFSGALAGTYSSFQSTLQAMYTTMVQNAITKITTQAEVATGAKIGGSRLATKLGKFSLITGSLAQYAGFYSSLMNIYQHNGEWLDAMGKGDAKLSTAAAGVMITNYGSQAYGTIAAGYTTVSVVKMRRRLQLLRGLYEAEKITNLANATSRAWAVRGIAFNSRLALLAKPTVILALLQFGAEYAYNRYNINDTLRWVKHSVWGIDDQGWDEKQHYQQMSKTISEPVMVYLGEQTEILYDPPNTKSQAYRYLHLVLKGQTYATFNKHSVQWEAGWVPEWKKETAAFYTGDAIPEPELTELLKKNATVVGHDPLIIQLKLPFNKTEGYKWPMSTKRARSLVLRLWYTPDDAKEQLGEAVKYTFSVDLPIDEVTLNAPKVITVTKDNRFYKYFKGQYKTEFTQADDQNKLI